MKCRYRWIPPAVLSLLIVSGPLGCGPSVDESATAPEPTAEQPVRSSSPDGAEVYFISPADGDTVDPSFVVRFGLKGMGVAPAGVDKENTGHHHLLIDAAELPPLDEPLLDRAMHFGGGQTETTLTLEPGDHTLQLILGNRFHIPHDPPVISDRITVTVR